MTGLTALLERVLLGTVRDRDLLLAVLVPVGTFIGFNLALRPLIDTGGMSYAQYVLPAVIVQAMLLGALTTADRAARDRLTGFGTRLRTLPIPPAAPLIARMSYCLLRGLIVVVATSGVGYVFGFRMNAGLGYAVAFVVLALSLTLGLSLGADAMGTRIQQSDASSQLLLIPQLLLVLLSTGMAPVEAFPVWVQGFVRYQPISQVTETMRAFTEGHFAWGNLVISLLWCAALIVAFGYAAVRVQRRVR
jgi:ABC-2 type transport system permease protein